MATAIPHDRITREGTLPPAGVQSDSAADFTIPTNDGNKVLVVHNAGGVAAVLHVVPQQTYGGLELAAQVLTVAPGATEYFGPWPPALFNDDSAAVEILQVSGVATLFSLGI